MEVGSWTDLGSTGVTSSRSKPYNAIDGNLIEVNGTYYLSYGSFWNGLYQVQMNGTPAAVVPSASASQLSYNSADKAQEAAYVFQSGNYYYLFYSKGSCCGYDKDRPARGKEYRIMVCRSSRATGGFTDKAGTACQSGGGTVVLESHDSVYGPGGQGVFEDPINGPVCCPLPRLSQACDMRRLLTVRD